MDAGVAPQEIPLPHEFFNRELMSQLYPSFSKD
jgi:photosystem I P700 chlorophyll a apoprotein A1